MDMTKRELAELVGISYDKLREIGKKLAMEERELFRPGEDPKKCDLAHFIREWTSYKADQAAMQTGTDMTKEQLADLVGIGYRQLYNIDKRLKEDEGETLFVKGEDARKCDLAFFIRRWVEYRVKRESASADDLDAVKAQHEEVKMRKTQLEVNRMEGQLVDVQDVRRLWGDIANTIMQGMLHLPSTLAPMVCGMENIEVIGSVIDTEIRKVLTGLSDAPLPAYLLLQDDDEDDDGE